MAYEALYRRFRPGRFDGMIGQEHVLATLKNALVNDRVGHAYLFSGPRGTGKTSSARILAKALNCTNLQEGEPCTDCDSCVAFQSGHSYDLYELDAASNNGVDAMRDLIQKVALGSPGRKKVYILDEVHMLSTGAENALLKTLEEPPAHVTFVLCTTEPNKVVPTVRSRTQHLEFRLYPADELTDLARTVAAEAGLTVDEAGINYAVRAAKGSARDMLSALDQVAAAGGVPDDDDQLSRIIASLVERDAGAALTAVNEATRLGRDPEVIGRGLLSELRNAFLASMRADLGHLSDADQALATERAAQLGAAGLTRSIEALGTAIIDMRQAPDPRVDLEVVLVRLTRPELDADLPALLARLERLEQGAPIAAMPASGTSSPVSSVSPVSPVSPVSHASEPASVDPSEEMPAPAAVSAHQPESVAAPAAPDLGSSPPVEAGQPPPRAAGARPADLARRNLPKRPGSGAGPSGATAPDPRPQRSPGQDKPTLGALRRGANNATQAAAPPQPVEASVQEVPQAAAPPQPVEVPMQEVPQVASSEPIAAPEEQVRQVASVEPSAPVAESASAGVGAVPSIDAVTSAWNESILGSLSGSVKARFSAGHFQMNGAALEFALPNGVHRDRCQDVRDEVDAALANHFGTAVPMAFVVGEPTAVRSESIESTPTTTEELLADEIMNVHELADATDDVSASVLDRLEEKFPGVEFLEPEQETRSQ